MPRREYRGKQEVDPSAHTTAKPALAIIDSLSIFQSWAWSYGSGEQSAQYGYLPSHRLSLHGDLLSGGTKIENIWARVRQDSDSDSSDSEAFGIPGVRLSAFFAVCRCLYFLVPPCHSSILVRYMPLSRVSRVGPSRPFGRDCLLGRFPSTVPTYRPKTVVFTLDVQGNKKRYSKSLDKALQCLVKVHVLSLVSGIRGRRRQLDSLIFHMPSFTHLMHYIGPIYLHFYCFAVERPLPTGDWRTVNHHPEDGLLIVLSNRNNDVKAGFMRRSLTWWRMDGLTRHRQSVGPSGRY
ncbi:hypothetical protein ACRALDRAFT_209559 [Sodiomyces alcalophilus JCM 7366]|uniref:uncharacterized protein n=1 Tax=Sodiomyces alcalophilus JCM 7366 TaxID=591952 RepID=UPI0039B3FD94